MLHLTDPTLYWGLAALWLVLLGLYLGKIRQVKTLEQREADLQSIFDAIPDGIVFTDLERKIARMNTGMVSLFGYDIDELVGNTTARLYERADDYEWLGQVRFNLPDADKLKLFEVIFRRKDGSTFVGETHSTAVNSADGQLLGFIGVTKDISERQKSEEKLELAASVFTHAREGIMITDANALIVEVNNTATEISGYSRQEMIGQNLRMSLQTGNHPSFTLK